MRRESVALLVSFLVLSPAVGFAGEAAKTATVKGTVTVGGKPTAAAVISIEGLPSDSGKAQLAQLKSKKATLDQKNMKFIPRVLAVVVGATVEFPNHDTSWHNVFSTSDAKKFALGLYAPGKSRSAAFDKAGVVKILCNVHPSMEAYVVVKSHPYFAAADAQGRYTLKDIPLGKTSVQVWHPDFGNQVVPVDLVHEGEVLAVDFDLKKK